MVDGRLSVAVRATATRAATVTGLIIEAHLAATDEHPFRSPVPWRWAAPVGPDREGWTISRPAGEPDSHAKDPVVAHDNAGLPGYERMSAYAREASRRIRYGRADPRTGGLRLHQ